MNRESQRNGASAEEPWVPLHPHFPCEGTPLHDGTCNDPQPLPEDFWKEVLANVEASGAQYSEWMQRAFNDYSHEETVPAAKESGTFRVFREDELPEMDLDDPRRSWAV